MVKEKERDLNELKTQASYFVEIPKEFVERLNLADHKTATVKLTEEGLLLKKEENLKQNIFPVKAVVISGLISLLAFVLIFKPYSQIPLTGDKSIATLVIIFGIITGMFNFTYYFTKEKKSEEKSVVQKISWRNYPTVLISYLIIMTLVLLFMFNVLGQFFSGVSFDVYTSTVIGTIMVSILNYIMIHIAQTLSPKRLINSLILIILSGVAIAMMTNKDAQWWTYNLSFLGTPNAADSWQFNLTLMISALLMIALIDYVFDLLYEIEGKVKRLIILKLLLVAIALCLGGVGFFPHNEIVFNQIMHNKAAGYLVYLFIILIVAIRWLLPSVTKQFLNLSYGIGLGLIVAEVLFEGVHYLSLTAFEIIAFVLAFSWLLLLLQRLVNIVMNTGQELRVHIKNTDKI